MTLIDSLAAALDGKRSGPGFIAKCPAHDDNRASLGIDVSPEGKVLVKCHAGCSQAAVLAALSARGLSITEGSGGNGAASAGIDPNARARTVPVKPARRIVTTYPYHDENGTLLFEVVRYDPKGFAQRRPDGNGDWVWGLDNTRRVLYRLPEIIAADPADPVYIVEGEKDADTLREHGIIATTSPQGASNWRPEYASALAGRSVVVLPDDDAPGRAYAAAVRESLEDVATSIHIVKVPSHDVTEWFQTAGGTPDALFALVAAEDPRIKLAWTFEPVLSQPREDRPPDIVEGFIGGNARVVLGGLPKLTRKSWFLMGLALSVASGKPFMGFPVRQGRTIYYSAEEPRFRVQERFHALARGMSVYEPNIPVLVAAPTVPRIRLSTAAHLDALKATIAKYQPSLVIMEPFRRLHDLDEDRSTEIAPLLDAITDLTQKSGITFVLAHHVSKGTTGAAALRGSGDLRSWYDLGIHASRKEKDDKVTLDIESRDHDIAQFGFVLNTHKDSNGDDIAWLERVDGDADGVKASGPAKDTSEIDLRVYSEIRSAEVKNRPHSGAEGIRKALGQRKDDVLASIERLINAGRIAKPGNYYETLS